MRRLEHQLAASAAAGCAAAGAAGAAGAAAGTQDVNVATTVTRINRTKMLRFIIPSLGCHVVGWTIRLWDAWGYSAGWCTSFSTRLDTELSRTRGCGWILTVSRPSPNSWPVWITRTIWRTAVRPSLLRILLDGCQRRREAGRLGDPRSLSGSFTLYCTLHAVSSCCAGVFWLGRSPQASVFLPAVLQHGARQCDIIVGAADIRCFAQASQGETHKEGSS